MKLAEETLAQIRVPRQGPGRPKQRPKRIIADKAYDSNPLRHRLRDRGIRLIVPYRKNRKAARPQPPDVVKHYRRRWIVERSISWLTSFRRLVVRHERLVATFSAFVHLACALIALRHLGF